MTNYYFVPGDRFHHDENADGPVDWIEAHDAHWATGMIVYNADTGREYVAWGLSEGRVWLKPVEGAPK